jgi:signal recognition particle subunit SEC65
MNDLFSCKTCGGRFSNSGDLVDHWNLHHKDKECLKCHSLHAIPSNSRLFCTSCEARLSVPGKNLPPIERLERQILRTQARAARWNSRLANLLLLREAHIEKRPFNGARFEEFCGHGNKKGRCIACNPIFEKITEKTMAEALRKLAIRERAEAESSETARANRRFMEMMRAMKRANPTPKKPKPAPVEIIELDLD